MNLSKSKTIRSYKKHVLNKLEEQDKETYNSTKKLTKRKPLPTSMLKKRITNPPGSDDISPLI